MPRWVHRFLRRLGATLSSRHESDLHDELQLHLRLLEEEYARQGVPPTEARERARREFGNPTLIQEASRELFSFRRSQELIRDVQYASREIRRRLGFATVAVLSLAAGIGAAMATFAVIDVLMLRVLPVRAPDQLVAMSTRADGDWANWSYRAFTSWRRSPGELSDVAASSDILTLESSARGLPAPDVRVALVSDNYFDVLGVSLARGRAFDTADISGTASGLVAVISERFWRQRFAQADDVLGRTIRVRDVDLTIVGVAGKAFNGHSFSEAADLWAPLPLIPAFIPDGRAWLDENAVREARWLKVIGRLREGSSADRVLAQVALVRQQSHVDASGKQRESVHLVSAARGDSSGLARLRRPALILAGITALVLLVACSNFANLTFARSEARRREFTIRLALGGGRWRIVRQGGIECALLALGAGALGFVCANWITTVAAGAFSGVIATDLAFEPNARVIAAGLGCVLLAMLAGFVPYLRAARSASIALVGSATAMRSDDRVRPIGGRIVLTAQLAMCAVLLLGAGLLLRTVSNLRSQDLGLDRDVLLVPIAPARAGGGPEAASVALDTALETIAALPGVERVGVFGSPLLDYTMYWVDSSQQLRADSGPVPAGSQWTSASVGRGFFAAAGISLAAGQTFDDLPKGAGDDAVVLNQSLARVFFGESNAVGRRISMSARGPMLRVIGVVNDARQVSPRDRGMGVIYLKLTNVDRAILAVRTAGAREPVGMRQSLIAALGPMTTGPIQSIAEALDVAISRERLLSTIALALALLCVALGCVGLYALMAYDVERRRRELGIRLALGATAPQVTWMILRDGAALVLPALVIGVPLGVAASHVLASQLYGVETSDPSTIASVGLLLSAVALVATLRPARTASRIDPLTLLRDE